MMGQIEVINYLLVGGYKEFKVFVKSGFVHVELWDIISFEQCNKIKTELEKIAGYHDKPYEWMSRLNFHAGNVRFKEGVLA